MEGLNQPTYENDGLIEYNRITEQMSIDNLQTDTPITSSRMNMIYRTYILHPRVDDYFYDNYPHYKCTPLIQNIYYLADCSKSELNGFTISVNIPMSGNICTDIYIKFGHLHSTCIKSIRVYINEYRHDNGPYYMDWITIYLYNIRHHPEIVARNIFILPNLILIASTMYTYTMDITFEHNSLYDYVFMPWRKEISSKMRTDIGSQIMKYLPNHILIDIYGRVDGTQSRSQINNSQIFTMLKSAYKSIYMTNYLLECNSEFVSKIYIHKNMMHNNMLFSYIYKDQFGQWIPTPQFNKLIITTDKYKHIITEHELSILPYLYDTHYVKNIKPIKDYSIPSKFVLTRNITSSGYHPYMYSFQLSDYINHSLIMGNDEEDSDNIIILEFERTSQIANIQLYIELSTK